MAGSYFLFNTTCIYNMGLVPSMDIIMIDKVKKAIDKSERAFIRIIIVAIFAMIGLILLTGYFLVQIP
jgi:hypothetical protein